MNNSAIKSSVLPLLEYDADWLSVSFIGMLFSVADHSSVKLERQIEVVCLVLMYR